MNEKQRIYFTPFAESWQVYQLQDGTVLRVRHIVIDVRRVAGKFTPDGTPFYEVDSKTIVVADAPAHLLKDFVAPSAKVAEAN